MKMTNEQILAYSYRYSGDWQKIKNAILRQEPYTCIASEEKYITILDKQYPDRLRLLENPPWILFYKGNIHLLKTDCIGIVGSRNACTYGKCVTQYVVHKNKNCTIVSGLAKGIDAVAHQTAIEMGKTIGVIGCGLATIYPIENKELYDKMSQNHLIITEYPFFVKVKKHHYPFRNRIIAALSRQLYVTQATLKSGTMHTVNAALLLPCEIYVAPYPLFDKQGEGCNILIQEGAQLIMENNVNT